MGGGGVGLSNCKTQKAKHIHNNFFLLLPFSWMVLFPISMAGELDNNTPIINLTIHSLLADTRPLHTYLPHYCLHWCSQYRLSAGRQHHSHCWNASRDVSAKSSKFWSSEVCAGQTNPAQTGLTHCCWSEVVSVFPKEPLPRQLSHPNLLPGIFFCSVPGRSFPNLLSILFP